MHQCTYIHIYIHIYIWSALPTNIKINLFVSSKFCVEHIIIVCVGVIGLLDIIIFCVGETNNKADHYEKL